MVLSEGGPFTFSHVTHVPIRAPWHVQVDHTLLPNAPKAKLPLYLHGLLKPPSPLEDNYLVVDLKWKPKPFFFALILVPPTSAIIPSPEVATASSSP